jgi:hypothetical protein
MMWMWMSQGVFPLKFSTQKSRKIMKYETSMKDLVESSLVLVDGDFPRIREPMILEARFKCSQIYPAAHQRTRHFCDPAYPCAKPSDTFRRRTTFCERRVSSRRTPNMEKMKKHQWRNDIIIWRYTFRHVFTCFYVSYIKLIRESHHDTRAAAADQSWPG